MTSETYQSWSDFSGVGPSMALKIRNKFETPQDYIDACREQFDEDVEFYAMLDTTLFHDIEGVGHTTADSIVDQLIASEVASDA